MVDKGTSRKEWTVMAYMAGDNNLDGAAVEDINEMEAAGSSDRINVIVQIDRAADCDSHSDGCGTTRRYYITRDSDRRRITSKQLRDLGPTNTGDSRFIEDFVRETVSDYPAKRYMLVLWNHGSGFYVPPEMLKREAAPSGRELSFRARPKLRRSFFHATREKILSLPPSARGICYDDGSQDCLDNQELKTVLADLQSFLKGKKVDLVGMDACLMTMLEVAYQVRDHAAVLVGSEENEPGEGWPYDRILSGLVANPGMNAADLGKAIVNRYIESYRMWGPFYPNVTQSAIDLSKLTDITLAVDELASALLGKVGKSKTQSAILRAWRKTPRFFDNMYIDLFRFAENLEKHTDDAKIGQACTAVKKTLAGKGAESPIIAERHLGDEVKDAHGLSIYMPPFKDPSDYYHDLDFSKDTRWDDFLDAYLSR